MHHGQLVELEPGLRFEIVFSSADRRSRWLAEAMAGRLQRLGNVAEIADATQRIVPPPADYDAVIVGLPARPRLDQAVLRWIHEAAPDLDETPSALFVIGSAEWYAHALGHVRHLGWWPRVTARFVREDDGAELAAAFAAIIEGENGARG